MKHSKIGDLTPLAKDLEKVFRKHLDKKVALAVAFTLEPEYNEVHWVTNVSRDNGIDIFKKTAIKMQAQIN